MDSSGEIWHSSVYNVKYRNIKQGQYVRIRAASLANHAGYTRTFGMRPYSNILTLPFPCKLANDMLFDEFAEGRGFEKAQLSSDQIIMHPVVISSIEGKVNEDVENLCDINNNDTKVHRVRVSVAHASSTEPAKCIRIREKGELKPVPANGQVKKGQELVTCMQFLVKDASQLASNKFTRLYLVDTGSFFGVKPKDILAKSSKLAPQVSQLERFNVWLEASVALKDG